MPAGIGYGGGGGGSYDLGYTPGNTAVGRSRFRPGNVAEGLFGDGGFNIRDTMQDAWNLAQQGKEEDMHRQLRMDQAMRTRNATGPAPPQQNPMVERIRGLEMARNYLNRLEGPDWYGTRRGALTQNPEFRNLMAAGKIAGINFDNGWDTYANLAGAAPPADPTAGARAANLQAQTQGLQQLGQQANMARMYPGMLPGQYGSGQNQGR